MDEFALIRRFFRERTQRSDVLLGPGDDAALLQPRAGQQLVMTMDTLLAGRHFPHDLPADAIGYRSLATNLSDLAAMGADPAWCLLSLSMPEARPDWLEAFCDGFFRLADDANISLVGGDLVRGELAISIQATGQLPAGEALLRSGARVGDVIVVGGVPGEAAAGLAQWQAGLRSGRLVERFCYPQPQLQLGETLRAQATSCIDISDGLLADLAHLLEESGKLGAEMFLGELPSSAELEEQANPGKRRLQQLSGGDDYLLLFTQAAEAPLPAGCFAIGRVTAEAGIRLLDECGAEWQAPRRGWQHF